MLYFMSSLSCSTISNLQLGAAFFAGLAAVLWLRASLVKIPSMDVNKLVIGDMGKVFDVLGRPGC
jgi:hypothetical protein